MLRTTEVPVPSPQFDNAMTNDALETQALSKSFGGVHALNGANLTFPAGKVTGLIGPNGAGKTTLFHLITGMLKPDAGTVRFRGRDLVGLSPWHIARLGVGRLFQDVRVFESLTVRENMLLGFHKKETPLAALLARRSIRREEERQDREAHSWLELVDLTSERQQPAESLSYGQQKLLALARILTAGADVLLLDEPTAGVNPVLIDRLQLVIRKLAQAGKTVVVIEHNMNVVLAIADWVYFIDDGKVTAFGLPEEVLSDADVRARYLGL